MQYVEEPAQPMPSGASSFASVHGGAEPGIPGPVRGRAAQQDPRISARMVPMIPLIISHHLKPPLLLFKYSANVTPLGLH